MHNFKDFTKYKLDFNVDNIIEEEGTETKISKIKVEIAAKFDEITEAKSMKKPGDINTDIQSLDKQSLIYSQISILMKKLSSEIRGKESGTDKSDKTVY